MNENIEHRSAEGIMRTSKYVLLAGLLVIAAGFLYDVMYAGIPYQDAPDYLLAEYDRHQRISNWIMSVGVFIVTVGGVTNIIFRFKRALIKS